MTKTTGRATLIVSARGVTTVYVYKGTVRAGVLERTERGAVFRYAPDYVKRATDDPTRAAHNVPPNVERYVNVYQSLNVMGGGDVVQSRRFHGHYASFNLKDHHEIVHINIEKAADIQEQLVTKIAELAATPADVGEAVPVRLDVPATAAAELWDNGLPVAAHGRDTGFLESPW